jgi:hypothetical protein
LLGTSEVASSPKLQPLVPEKVAGRAKMTASLRYFAASGGAFSIKPHSALCFVERLSIGPAALSDAAAEKVERTACGRRVPFLPHGR